MQNNPFIITPRTEPTVKSWLEWGKEKDALRARLMKEYEECKRERDEARACARAILLMVQEYTGRQFVSDHVLTRHPWLADTDLDEEGERE